MRRSIAFAAAVLFLAAPLHAQGLRSTITKLFTFGNCGQPLCLAGSVLAEPLQVVDGKITPRGPGLGLDWDDKAVARFAA